MVFSAKTLSVPDKVTISPTAYIEVANNEFSGNSNLKVSPIEATFLSEFESRFDTSRNIKEGLLT